MAEKGAPSFFCNARYDNGSNPSLIDQIICQIWFSSTSGFGLNSPLPFFYTSAAAASYSACHWETREFSDFFSITRTYPEPAKAKFKFCPSTNKVPHSLSLTLYSTWNSHFWPAAFSLKNSLASKANGSSNQSFVANLGA